jgi:hypothetical protein
MAKIDDSLLKGLRGALGKQLVVKQWRDKVVVTKYPDMRRVKPSELQKIGRNLFAEAVAYASAINRNPIQKAAYLQKVKDGETVYHYAIKEYFEKNRG